MTNELKERLIEAISRYVEENATEEMATAILEEAKNLEYYGCRGRDSVYKTETLIAKIREREEKCMEVVFFDTEIHLV